MSTAKVITLIMDRELFAAVQLAQKDMGGTLSSVLRRLLVEGMCLINSVEYANLLAYYYTLAAHHVFAKKVRVQDRTTSVYGKVYLPLSLYELMKHSVQQYMKRSATNRANAIRDIIRCALGKRYQHLIAQVSTHESENDPRRRKNLYHSSIS